MGVAASVFRCALITYTFSVALAAGMPSAFAQNPSPLPNPNLTFASGVRVSALAALPDGGAVFAGNFTLINGSPRYGMARLKSDGTLDPNWSVCANGPVATLAADGSGNIYFGGSFTRIGPDWFSCMQNTGLQVRNRLARLKADGTLDTGWTPAADGDVFALGLDGNGNLYASGGFSTIGGQARKYLARLRVSDGTADPVWNPNIDANGDGNEGFSTFAFDGTGAVYVGGSFLFVNNFARNGIARLKPDGTLDTGWNPSPDPFSIVSSLIWDGAGNLIVGGHFSHMGGTALNNIAKLKSDGTADATWNPNANDSVAALVPAGDGGLFVAGNFTGVGGQPRSSLAKLAMADATVDAHWDPGADAGVEVLVSDNRGHLYAAGGFGNIGGESRQALALLPASDRIFSNGFETN